MDHPGRYQYLPVAGYLNPLSESAGGAVAQFGSRRMGWSMLGHARAVMRKTSVFVEIFRGGSRKCGRRLECYVRFFAEIYNV